MITRDNIRELANFEAGDGCAISFFYQPAPPKDKSHREEAILLKDQVRDALREAEKQGRNGCAKADLDRILELAERLHGNGGRAKAIFASGKNNFWREFDLPARLAGTRIYVNKHFHLRPLTAIADVLPRLLIVLVDKTRARFFELWMDEIHERENFRLTNEITRRGRSDGFAGYEAGHAERHVDNEAMHFYKEVSDRMKDLYESGYERFLIGCRDETWPEVEPHLHSYIKQKFVGHFSIDPATASPNQVKEQAERLYNEFRMNRRAGLVREAVGQEKRNSRGAVGLKQVLDALEKGEIQTLLISKTFSAPATQCTNCGHLDANMAATCSACARKTRELEDVADRLLSAAVKNNIEIIHMHDDPAFAATGGVAALLRFRADQNTEVRKAG
jgi:peptide subunit release factor 1 (eRF1)